MGRQKDVWTVVKLIDWSAAYLQGKGIDNARLNVERLLCAVLRCSRVALYLDFDRPLDETELADFKKLLLRRASREPLQYILGETEFFSLTFQVKPGVLVPRPETEMLVEHAASCLTHKNVQQPKILDVGTGSGIIAIALAKKIPPARLLAIDISEKALQVAKENASAHNLTAQIDFAHCDVREARDWQLLGETRFDLIVSNPPYIASSEKNRLAPEVRDFEPPEALFVDEPMQFYRVLLLLARQKLAPSGYLACEIAAHRHREVESLFAEAGMHNIRLVPDLAGNKRVISAQVA